MPDARSDWELINAGLKAYRCVSGPVAERGECKCLACSALAALSRLRSQMEQQEGEIAKLKLSVTAARERWTKVLNREFKLKGLIREVMGLAAGHHDLYARLASVGTQGEYISNMVSAEAPQE